MGVKIKRGQDLLLIAGFDKIKVIFMISDENWLKYVGDLIFLDYHLPPLLIEKNLNSGDKHTYIKLVSQINGIFMIFF